MNRHETIRRMQALLLRRREELSHSLDLAHSQLRSAPDRGVGDTIDAATDSEQTELSSRLAQAESQELAHINDALTRMRSGRYGHCENCGRRIPLARLKAIPCATLCVRCQRQHEEPTEISLGGATAVTPGWASEREGAAGGAGASPNRRGLGKNARSRAPVRARSA